MRYIKNIILAATLLFGFYLSTHQINDECIYYSTEEEYHLNYESQIISIPIFVYGDECIFKSEMPSYYLKLADTMIKLKKSKVENFSYNKVFNQNIKSYIISFELNLEENTQYNNVILEIEMPAKSLFILVGNIVVHPKESIIKNINSIKNEEGIFISENYFNILDKGDFNNIYYNEEKGSFFNASKKQIYYSFIYLNDNIEEMGIIRDNNYDLLSLSLKEGYYAQA